MGDAADDRVALHPHRCEVAVADAGDRELSRAGPRAHAVADRPGADAHDVHRLAQERVERDDLVHLAAADVHVVGDRVRELGGDRPDLAAHAAEVVEQPRPLDGQLGEERGQGEDVRERIIPVRARRAFAPNAIAVPSAAPASTSVG